MPRRPQILYQELAFVSVDTSAQAIAPAIGTISCAANTAAADGDFVTLGDGMNPAVTYEYDKGANGVTAGRINWPVGTTAASNATALAALISANQPGLAVADDLAGNLAITHKWPGVAGNVTITKTGAVVTTVTGMTGGSSGAVAVTTPLPKFWFNALRTLRVDSVEFLPPAGFAADSGNFWTISLNNGATVIASWSTQASAQGAIVANTPINLILSATDANLVVAAASALTVVLTKTGTPSPLPGGRFNVHGHYVS